MIRYLLRRTALTIPLVLTVAFFVFSLLHLSGGDPAAIIAGDGASPERIAAIRRALGLDRPFLDQFGLWLWALLQGDLGQSLFAGKPVADLILQRLEPSLSIAVATLVLSVAIAIPLGVVAAWKAGSWSDHLTVALSVAGFSVPVFVTSYAAIYLFSLTLGWLPVQGFKPISAGIGPFLRHIILPSAMLSISYVGLVSRITRSAMIDVLGRDYIRTAAAKGVSQPAILGRHALKNAAVPIVTAVGLGFAFLVGGVVVTETVFGIPGLGRLTVDAIARRDYPVVQGVILVISCVYILVNLLVDLSYALFDPRIRY